MKSNKIGRVTKAIKTAWCYQRMGEYQVVQRGCWFQWMGDQAVFESVYVSNEQVTKLFEQADGFNKQVIKPFEWLTNGL